MSALARIVLLVILALVAFGVVVRLEKLEQKAMRRKMWGPKKEVTVMAKMKKSAKRCA